MLSKFHNFVLYLGWWVTGIVFFISLFTIFKSHDTVVFGILFLYFDLGVTRKELKEDIISIMYKRR